MIEPNQYQVNEAWIAFKLNDAPIFTKQDGDFNVFALMDVASCYMLTTEFVSSSATELSELESKRLIKSGYSRKNELPKKMYIPIELLADNLRVEVERRGITLVDVPEQELLSCVGEVRKGFKEHMKKGSYE